MLETTSDIASDCARPFCTVLCLIVVLLLRSIEDRGNPSTESSLDAPCVHFGVCTCPNQNVTLNGLELVVQGFEVWGFGALASGFAGWGWFHFYMCRPLPGNPVANPLEMKAASMWNPSKARSCSSRTAYIDPGHMQF